MNFIEETAAAQKELYFRMLDKLEALRDKGLNLLDAYFEIENDPDLKETVGKAMERTSKEIAFVEDRIKEYTQLRFSKAEIEALKIERALTLN
jgi:hypothetical protein